MKGGRGGRPAPTPDRRWSKSADKVVVCTDYEEIFLLGNLVAEEEEHWLVVKEVEHTLKNIVLEEACLAKYLNNVQIS